MYTIIQSDHKGITTIADIKTGKVIDIPTSELKNYQITK